MEMEADVADAKGFYGVYLLCSESTGRCYIGFTVNPNRRIKQHNRGLEFGGAKKTNNKGPWKMILLIHGFPNNIAALQFEWAWQQPTLSSRLKEFHELKRKQTKENFIQYNLRILNRMLLVGPWMRLPLTIRWLEPTFAQDFPEATQPPSHMKIVYGKISLKNTKRNKNDQPAAIWSSECHLCMEYITNPKSSRIGCSNSLCKLTCHIICLANYILDKNNQGHYIPIVGVCPLCETIFTWAMLLQRKRNLERNSIEDGNEDSFTEGCDEHDTDSATADIYEISD
ncbi:structure-specific endonuclease subunit SLX1 homolog [Teleopsis dalmanni]|uniref:structure-specific endonuclease subunit SLX1 homolog n=1 Tax=Teleopsis dalmanni TaxID=139649 RepID=UPI0018CDD66D|nr:structure-specific endonuclease subunit SLX1 homolog [Teleopsis dalmanni]